MNYFEFINILQSDPYCQKADFLSAIKSDPRCRRAYKLAMEKERIIRDALNISVPVIEIEHIRLKQTQVNQQSLKQRFFAVAATVVMMVGAGLFMLANNRQSDLEKFINEALLMEPAVYMSENEIPQAELDPLFASINTAVDGNLGQVHFMKLCPTLNGKGARMVLMNEINQPITVLYMPNSPIEEAIEMQMEGFTGKIVALEQGSAAIIARPHESTVQIENALKNSLRALQ
ncbi:MAG: DUF3379 family protein [Xanthomonadales bacterium]|nr:DUF3379 family protein [Xanthomonadales bacterium]